ncbi:MAG: tetratricopeptide repeat protein [Caldilineaceae bacterium]
MKHHLVPEIILRQMAWGRPTGSFHAICLFVDVSGFTALATTLTEHGLDGAETIAEVIGAIFEPLIEIIYSQGGFVAGFAGDAFKAVFPTAEVDNAYGRAAVAAQQVSHFVSSQPSQLTRFGCFNFAIKVAVADGRVTWGIWRATIGEEGSIGHQRAAYYLLGEALDRCLDADAFVPAGAVLLTEAVYTRLPEADFTCEQFLDYRRLTQVDEQFIHALPSLETRPSDFDRSWSEMFFPLDLLRQQHGGEFRQVVAMFVNLPTLPSTAAAPQFQQTFFHLLAQYGGYLDSMGRIGAQDPGCTLVLFWGAPVSYENNVMRALDFILALRNASPLPTRAGITYNLAYAGFIGSAQRTEYTCYSLHVALAARQMTTANWGEILVDEMVARQAESDFHIVEQGHYHFKGFAEERPVFLLEKRREPASVVYAHIPLVGRRGELDQLAVATQPIFQSKFGGAILVIGEAGIGKTRLIHEFQVMLEGNGLPNTIRPASEVDDGQDTAATQPFSPLHLLPKGKQSTKQFTWLHCRADEITRQPLQPFRACLLRYFNQSLTQAEDYNRQQFFERLNKLMITTPAQELTAELQRAQSVLAAFVGLSVDDPFYQQLEPQQRFENTREVLKTFFKAESLCQPLIIHLEDAQWLDTESLHFIEQLARNVDKYPFVLLVTTRPRLHKDEKRIPIKQIIPPIIKPCTIIPLQSLSRNDLHLLAGYHLEGMVTASLVDLLNEHAQGNPFFAEQMLLYWEEHGLLRWGDMGWHVQRQETALNDITPLSPNVRTILTARLDRLPQPLKEVVQTAAVLGNEFPLQVLAHILHDNPALPAQVAAAEQAAIWTLVTPASGLFRHALLCAAAYSMQSRARLQQLHRRAANAIQEVYQGEPGPHYAELVYHYRQSGDQEQERQYAQLAGEFATAQYANEDAVRYLSRALVLTPPADLASRYKLLVDLEGIHKWLGNRTAQAEDLQQQLELATQANNPLWRAESALEQADYERSIGNYGAAITQVQQSVQLAVELGNGLLQGQAYHAWGRILRQQGEYEAAQEQLQRALQLAQSLGNHLLEANSRHDIGHLYYLQGDYPRAAAYYQHAEQMFEKTSDRKGQINCLIMFGVINNVQGDFDTAQQCYTRALTLAHYLGWRHGETFCLSNLGNNHFDVGDYHSARTAHLQALYICSDIGDREGEAVSLDTLGLIAHSQSDYPQAEEYYRRALEIQQQLGDPHGQGYTLTHLGHTLLATGQLPQALACFQDALQWRQSVGERPVTLDSLAGLALAQWQMEELASALDNVYLVLNQLQSNGVAGVEFPVQVYLICYQVLAAAQAEPNVSGLANVALHAAYQLVEERAARLTDPRLRQMFLANVPFNRTVVALWQGQVDR